MMSLREQLHDGDGNGGRTPDSGRGGGLGGRATQDLKMQLHQTLLDASISIAF